MKVCDVVLNSIWYDPRVRKQIVEYIARDIELSCVGMKCARYDFDKIQMIPCSTNVVKIPEEYDGQQKSVFRKLKREWLRFKMVRDAIIEEKPDLIHANDLNALIPAYAAKRKLHCKLIYDSHEINVENYTTEGRSPLAGIMRMIEKYMVNHIDLMVCVSNAASDYFASEYGIRKPMVVTNCSLRKETLSETSEKHKEFEILNHGQFYPGRGYEEMVEAAELLTQYPGVRFCVRGFGKLEQSMREHVIDKSLNNFIFYPPVNVEQLIPEAAHSHVGVAITKPICLNFKLSVSNKLFEYAAAGLPVIMSDIPEHRYLNKKYSFGLVIPENTPKALADAVMKLYQDEELYSTLAGNAKRMSQELNWENEFCKLIDVEKAMFK